MSAGDDDLFARWSRRKQAVLRVDAEEAASPGARAAETDADPLPELPAPDPPEPLPSLDDLTADGDLSAFLHAGVPAALKKAAMRKMWSLDPAIRDHVGLSENAWDFNRPGAMTGFGPLEAGRAVADFLSGRRETPADPEGATAASDAPAAAPEPTVSLPPDEPAQAPDAPEDPLLSAEFAEAAGPADSSGTPPRPRHGGALPR